MKKIISASLAIIILATFILASSSCNSYNKQLENFQSFGLQHQSELAKICTAVFPAKDSLGEVKTDYKPANNVNYKPSLDSLQAKFDSLASELAKDASNISNPCIDIVKKYQAQVTGLNQKLSTITSAYQKCKPDTITKMQYVYRVDQAALKVCENNMNIISDSLKVQNTNLDNEKNTSGKRMKWMWVEGGIILALAGALLLKFTGRI